MEILTGQSASTRIASLILTHPSWFLLFSLACFAIALSRRTLKQSSKAGTSSMSSLDDTPATPTVKESRPKFREGGKWHLTMDLRKPERETWLEMDDQYLPEHNIRSKLLNEKKSAVIQRQPGSEAACAEVLELVAQDLTTNFPQQFKAWPSPSELEMVEIVATGEVFRVRAPFREMEPLEVAARLAGEDLNILIKGGKDEHTL